jgi:hypothetical protein
VAVARKLSLCYYTVCGSAENSTNHCATQTALEARRLKGSSEEELKQSEKLKNRR